MSRYVETTFLSIELLSNCETGWKLLKSKVSRGIIPMLMLSFPRDMTEALPSYDARRPYNAHLSRDRCLASGCQAVNA